jgi:hypothetical protein
VKPGRCLATAVVAAALLLGPPRQASGAEAAIPLEETRRALAVSIGTTYDPVGDIRMLLLHHVWLIDYDRVMPHLAPAALRFKTEATLGLTDGDPCRAIASANMLAFHYLDWPHLPATRLYGEAGIGLIYTDFRVEGQGLRFNFNPVFGGGLEFRTDDGRSWSCALRFHHLSNADLHHENRGINSVLLQFGLFY